MTTAVVFATLIGLMLINVPIAVATGLCAIAGLLATGDAYPLVTVVQRMFVGINSFSLLAVPLFILAGRLMSLGGITNDLVQLSRNIVGFMRGGLAYITIVASMFFAGLTGSAAADASSVGGILVPAMIKKGYHKDFTVAVTATAGTIGVMIPPSIPAVLYGVASGTSIGKLFIGGIVPGLLVGAVLMAIAGTIARKRNYPIECPFNARETLRYMLRAIMPLMAIFIILGGIITGWFTATEAAGVAVLYAFLLGVFYYRELKLSDIMPAILDVAVVTGMVNLMVATASALAWLLAAEDIPELIGHFLINATGNVYLLLLLINILLLFVGTWMDLAPAVIIFTPMLLPIVTAVGVDPVHFGVIMVVNLAIGLFTPPVGVCLFVTCGIAQVQITEVVRAFIPFFIGMVGVLMLITYVPELVMFLPNLLMK